MIYNLLVLALAAVLLILLFKISIKLGINALIGFLGLLVINIILSFFNMNIPYNIITVLVSGFFGVFGIILLFIYYYII